MLKCKFYRVKNIVLLEVLEQGEEIKRGSFAFDDENGQIFSRERTGLEFGNFNLDPRIYVRGLEKDLDTSIAALDCETEEDAIKYITKAKDLIEAYNSSLTRLSMEKIDNNIETIIVGG